MFTGGEETLYVISKLPCLTTTIPSPMSHVILLPALHFPSNIDRGNSVSGDGISLNLNQRISRGG